MPGPRREGTSARADSPPMQTATMATTYLPAGAELTPAYVRVTDQHEHREPGQNDHERPVHLPPFDELLVVIQ